MEPIAELIDDLFIIYYGWRYWLLGAGCVIPIVFGLRGLAQLAGKHLPPPGPRRRSRTASHGR